MEAHDDSSPGIAGGVIGAKLDRLAELVNRQPAERQAALLESLEGEHMLSKELKAAIEASGKSAYSLGHEAGVRPEIITRFLSGERDLRLETAGKIAAVLGQELRQAKRVTARKAK